MPLWRWNRDADETRIDAGITQLFSRQPQSLLCDRALHSLCIISPSCYCSRAQHALSSDSQTHTNNMTMFRTSSTRSHRNMSLAHYEAWHTCQQCLMSIKGQRGYLGRGREGYRIIKNNIPVGDPLTGMPHGHASYSITYSFGKPTSGSSETLCVLRPVLSIARFWNVFQLTALFRQSAPRFEGIV
jgi:hypothetical protein